MVNAANAVRARVPARRNRQKYPYAASVADMRDARCCGIGP
jgi:hypothetical protein